MGWRRKKKRGWSKKGFSFESEGVRKREREGEREREREVEQASERVRGRERELVPLIPFASDLFLAKYSLSFSCSCS